MYAAVTANKVIFEPVCVKKSPGQENFCVGFLNPRSESKRRRSFVQA